MNLPNPFIRFAAYLIDILVIVGLFMACGLILSLTVFISIFSLTPMIGFYYFGGVFVLPWLYYAMFESSKWQATVGKRVLGLRVVDVQGNKVGFGRATGRHFSKLFSYLTLYVGFLMPLWTKKRQALHDKIASTIVILNKKEEA